MLISTRWGRCTAQQKAEEKWCERVSCFIQELYTNWLCVSRNLSRREDILRKTGKLRSNCTVTFSKGTWHHIKIRERKGPSRGVIQKCEFHERSPCDPKFEEMTQDETLHQEQHVRGVACVFGEECLEAQNNRDKSNVLLTFRSLVISGDQFIGNYFRCGVLELSKSFLFAWAWILFA